MNMKRHKPNQKDIKGPKGPANGTKVDDSQNKIEDVQAHKNGPKHKSKKENKQLKKQKKQQL